MGSSLAESWVVGEISSVDIKVQPFSRVSCLSIGGSGYYAIQGYTA